MVKPWCVSGTHGRGDRDTVFREGLRAAGDAVSGVVDPWIIGDNAGIAVDAHLHARVEWLERRSGSPVAGGDDQDQEQHCPARRGLVMV